MHDIRKNKKVTMNRQPLDSSPFFAMRKTNVKWPTYRKGYLNEDKINKIKEYALGKGRSIVFLGPSHYETKLNRYKNLPPDEQAMFFEFQIKDKNIKGAIHILVWLGSFHNGCIIHFAPQFPQMMCWLECGGNDAIRFFEKGCFKIYREIANILYEGIDNIKDEEVKEFILNGDNYLRKEEFSSILS